MRIAITRSTVFFVRGLVILGACSGAWLQAGPATTRHFWGFEGAEPFRDQVGKAHAEVSASTTVLLEIGHDGAGQSMRTRSLITGVNDFARITDSAQLTIPGEGAFSMSGWFRMPAASANNRGVFDFSGNGFDGPQMLLTSADSLNFRIDGLGTYNLVAAIPNASVEDDAWHFFAAVYDPALETETLRFYLDGSTPAATASRGATPATAVSPHANAWLGTFNFTGGAESKGLDGMLDELAYFEGVLTQEQISALFARTLHPLDLAPPPPPAFAILSARRNPTTGEFTLTWQSEPDVPYHVIGCDDLESWADLHFAAIPGTGEILEFKFTPPGNPPRYFFRVERP